MYDLDQDGVIRWDEYSLVNKYHGRSIKGAADTFTYLDGNNDWEITRAEFMRTNLQNLDPKLPNSVRRKAPIPRHGSTAAAPAAAGAATAGAATRGVPSDPYDRVNRAPRSTPRRDPYDPYMEQPPRRQDAAPGGYDIVVDPSLPASERIAR